MVSGMTVTTSRSRATFFKGVLRTKAVGAPIIRFGVVETFLRGFFIELSAVKNMMAHFTEDTIVRT